MPNEGYRLDFYWSFDAGPAGRGIPDYPLGRASTNLTDADGHVHFQVRLPSPVWISPLLELGQVSATATDTAGNTSEIGVAVLELPDRIFNDGFE